jgi:acetyltransferase
MNIHLLHPARNRKPEAANFKADNDHRDPEQTLYLKEYGRIKLRPIRLDDEPRMTRFHENLSEESIYLRYFEHISLDTRTLHERLAKVCANSPDSFAIVAERHESTRRSSEILAVGRLTTTDDPDTASFAMLMGDKAQDTELPRHLLSELIQIARIHGFRTLTGELLVADHDTLDLCRRVGFSLRTIPDDGLVRVSYAL